jgi:hypothetical protein
MRKTYIMIYKRKRKRREDRTHAKTLTCYHVEHCLFQPSKGIKNLRGNQVMQISGSLGSRL